MHQETAHMIMDEDRIDQAWEVYRQTTRKPKVALSDLDPKIIELITQKVLDKIAIQRVCEEELRWLADHPEHNW
jgi:hypothetical protein